MISDKAKQLIRELRIGQSILNSDLAELSESDRMLVLEQVADYDNERCYPEPIIYQDRYFN